ncbi:response regulator transcription factor [Clostridium sp. AL.422]|uniref:response regulator transcription factor n=1 Tax=Clostridium TaxID=1485 RepID=UPI00293DFF8E|nr:MULTISPECIES: response regulator transcription factor [unclassified Clostridium]MDV4149456.1 response regulator transcription factor [Clostridium sp. AL.422]
MGKYKVLVVDDEKEITDAIEIYLKNENIDVIKAYDGIEALNIIKKEDIHLVIMDLMMPKMDGMRTTMNIREDKNIPIIILSAKSQDTDKILGLNIGADDYITKPFNPLELIARVKSQLRRYVDLGNYPKEENDILVYGIIKLDRNKKLLEVDGKEVKITKTEYGILDLLLSSPGRVFSSKEIYGIVWNEPCFNADTVMVHVRRIREKIEVDPKKPRYIKVVWGVGYKFEK